MIRLACQRGGYPLRWIHYERESVQRKDQKGELKLSLPGISSRGQNRCGGQWGLSGDLDVCTVSSFYV